MNKNILFPILLLLFLGRLWYATTTFGYLDSFQVYLIGLKYYTSGVFPYWGADVVYTDARIPGALQGMLVGGMLKLWAIPESPYILLQVLTFACVGLFVRYLRVRIPEIPAWFTWIWLLTAPWMLFYTTRTENPSYVIPMAFLFFMAVWELLPIYPNRLIGPSLGFFTLGFALLWIFQLHMSWVLLLPYIGAAFFFNRTNKGLLVKYLGYFVAGAAISGGTLWPTLLQFGGGAFGGTEQNIAFNPANAQRFGLVVGRFFSFGAYETARFCGNHTVERIAFLQIYIWAAPAAVFVTLIGVLQVLLFVISLGLKKPFAEWNAVRVFTVASCLLVYGGFLFAVPPPFSHAYVLMLPVMMWYSFYCYRSWANRRWFKPLAAAFLLSGMIYQVALALETNQFFGIALHRTDLKRAIAEKDYTIAGLRRDARFEKMQYEAIWTNSVQGDTLEYNTGFEYSQPWFMPQNIVQTTPASGRFCAKIDSLQPYGPVLEISVSQLGQRRHIHLSFAYKSNHTESLILVANVKEGKNSLNWEGQPVTTTNDEQLSWHKKECSLQLPDTINPLSTFQLYIWGRFASKKQVSYWDDVVVEMW